MHYIARPKPYVSFDILATTDHQAEASAREKTQDMGYTEFRLYHVDQCPTCHQTRETYLGLWELREGRWTLVEA